MIQADGNRWCCYPHPTMTTMTIARASQVAKEAANLGGYALVCFWETLLNKPLPAFPRRFRWDIPIENRTSEADAIPVKLPPGERAERLVNLLVMCLAAEQVDGMIKQRRAFVPPSYWETPKEKFWWLDLEKHFQATEPKDNPGTVIVESEKKSDLPLLAAVVAFALERVKLTPSKDRPARNPDGEEPRA